LIEKLTVNWLKKLKWLSLNMMMMMMKRKMNKTWLLQILEGKLIEDVKRR